MNGVIFNDENAWIFPKAANDLHVNFTFDMRSMFQTLRAKSREGEEADVWLVMVEFSFCMTIPSGNRRGSGMAGRSL